MEPCIWGQDFPSHEAGQPVASPTFPLRPSHGSSLALLCYAEARPCELLRPFPSLSVPTLRWLVEQLRARPTSVGLGSDAQACQISSAEPGILRVLLLSPACVCVTLNCRHSPVTLSWT